MDKETKETRDKLKNISTLKEFNFILNEIVLSEEERILLRLHYIEQKPLSYISDELGMSEPTIKRKHRKLLLKITKLLS